MKKFTLLAAALFTTLALCSCCDSRPLHRRYAEKIKEQLDIGDEDWFYTYQKVEPKSSTVYLIDFYAQGNARSHSTWYCSETKGIDCHLLQITYY